MKPPVKMALGVVAFVLAAGVVMAAWSRYFERQATLREIERLRGDLYQARVAADRCRGSLQTSEASLLGLGSALDSMRARVDSFETLDRRGVPEDRYDEYMELFDSYNDSVGVWEERERRLRTAETACRETIEVHNAISDTLQQVLAEAGIETS